MLRTALWAAIALLFLLTIDVLVLAEAVSERMEGRIHDQPARITAQTPRLTPGAVATRDGWNANLRQLGYREAASLAGVQEGEFHLDKRRWRIHPTGGELLELRLEGRRVRSLEAVHSGVRLPAWDFPLPALSVLTGEDRERRSVVPIEDIPLSLIRATVAIEDERFYRHHGIDPRGILRAAFRNIQDRGISQGGSTITQQLAKNMFLRADRTFRRKFQEALLALILEQSYSKDEILAAYLNEIYLGQRDGYAIMGVGEAARVWFGKDVANLSLGESAVLAGAIHAPNRTVPWKHPGEAKSRQEQVISRMRALEAFPDIELDAALKEPINTASKDQVQRRAPWFVDAVVGDLQGHYTPEALHREGLELVTTLDLRFQPAAEASVKRGIEQLRERHPELWSKGRGPEVALVAMEPSTGAVRALVGGTNYAQSQFNRAIQARRQPGSAFKPVVLAAAIGDQWPTLGPRSRVSDLPITVPRAGRDGRSWSPKNYDGLFLGGITLREATEKSRNLPFIQLALDIGLPSIQSTAEAMGIVSPVPAVPSAAIGTVELSPLELATAYSTLANGGLRPEPHYLVGVRNSDGDWVERTLPRSTAAIDPRVAAVVTDLLEGVIDNGTARDARSRGLVVPLAGKTGTTNESRDTWMAGYSTDLAVVVWVGQDSNQPLQLSSTQTALPIWADFFRRVQPHLKGEPFPLPRGTRRVLAGMGERPHDHAIRAELEAEDRERRHLEAEEIRNRRP
ncbi:MAG: PBP1A family penicillin-binding protein [Myxococcota bacterium]|nr:PBP1A family penicillin-binding protein [Myxococcota bacterium]